MISHNNQKMMRMREEDSEIGSGDNRGDTEMRDVENRTRTKTRDNEGIEHRAG